MKKEEFKNLYKILLEQKNQQKEKDIFIIQFDIQNTKFNFFKNEDKHYLCKFSFQFLDEPQRVTVEFNHKNNLKFIIDDTNQHEQIYDLKEFKQYFNPQFILFKEAFEKFKQFLKSKEKLKTQKNVLKIIPLNNLVDKFSQSKINIKGITFTFNKIKNTFKDVYRVDFEIDQIDKLDLEKYISVIFKALTNTNYYILEIYLSKENNIQDSIKIDKEEFIQKYPTYVNKLNKAIQTYLTINN